LSSGLVAKIYDVKLGTKAWRRQRGWRQAPCYVTPRRQGLGANDPGVMPLYLGAGEYDAKNKVYFLHLSIRGIFVRFFRKRKKNKKDSARCYSDGAHALSKTPEVRARMMMWRPRFA
jgi:hypothetical protein